MGTDIKDEEFLEFLNLDKINPIRPGEWGGGGSEARMTKLTADNQKPLTL